MNGLPRIVCLMTSSLDGGLHPSRWTTSPDGSPSDWSRAYERIHAAMGADGWIVGRTTMAEMANGDPHPPERFEQPPRPHHFATRTGPFAIALDRSGKLHFSKPDIGGDQVIVLLGPDVSDQHLAELVDDGISYIVAGDDEMNMSPLLATLRNELAVSVLILEGGGRTNGSFLSAGLVDELHIVLAPALEASRSSSIVNAGDGGLLGKIRLSLAGCEPIANGALHLRYTIVSD